MRARSSRFSLSISCGREAHAVLLFQEHDELQRRDRIEDAAADERRGLGELIRILARKELAS